VSRLVDRIREAVETGRYIVSWHAYERCEERRISAWQVAAGLREGRLIEQRPHSVPNPSMVVRQVLADGSEVVSVWSWLGESRRAKLVTVFF